MNVDEVLLGKLNKAVAAANEAEKTVETARAELVSKSKAVGILLLEAKKRYPKVADFRALLKRVNGLKLSRAYDYMRIAGGRVTYEELREEARERKRKSRAKRLPPQAPSLPKAEPIGKADSFRDTPHVTESPEISAEQRRAENARSDEADDGSSGFNNDDWTDEEIEAEVGPLPSKEEKTQDDFVYLAGIAKRVELLDLTGVTITEQMREAARAAIEAWLKIEKEITHGVQVKEKTKRRAA